MLEKKTSSVGNSFVAINTLDGGSGNDFLTGGSGHDDIYGFGGNDTLNGSSGDDLLVGGSGKDLLKGGRGIDDLYGDGGRDILKAGAGADSLDGGNGNDLLIGGDGRDIYYEEFFNGNDFGDDVIRDADDNKVDIIDLFNFEFDDLAALEEMDTNGDDGFDALLITLDFGTILVEDYFANRDSTEAGDGVVVMVFDDVTLTYADVIDLFES